MNVCVFGLWHLGTVTAACLAAAGHQVVGLDFDPHDKLWLVDVATGTTLAEIDLAPKSFANDWSVAFSDDGRQLAVLGDDNLRVYDLPLRRPWSWIVLVTSAGISGFVGLDRIVCRLWRRRRAAA